MGEFISASDGNFSEKKRFQSIDIYTFLIIFLTSSFVITNDVISSIGTIILWLFTMFALLLRKRYLLLNDILVPIFISTVVFASYLICEDDFVNGLKILFTLMGAMLYVANFDYKEIRDSVIRVIKFLTIIAITLYFLYIIVPDLSSMFLVPNRDGTLYSCLFLYVYVPGAARNCGMFWEPGAYQAFINTALLLEISKTECDLKTVLLFALGVITTFSTTGYIALFILILFYFLKHTDKSLKSMARLLLVFGVIILMLYIFRDYIFSDSQNTVFGKISTFFEYEEYDNTRRTSASARYFAITEPLKVFLRYPIFGAGKTGTAEMTYTYTQGNLTCTMINWFAFYGVIYGLVMSIGYIKFSRKLFDSIGFALLCFVCFAIITASEDFSSNAFFYVFSFAGYANMYFSEIQAEDY